MRRVLAVCAAIALSTAILLADDRVVLFDEDVDFSTFKTFMIGSGRMKSDRPELNFPAVLSSLADAIRSGLKTKSLKEVSDNASLMVDFSVIGVDFVIGDFGKPNPVVPGQRGRGRAGSATVDFTEATLVIDLKDGRSNTLIWRGVYHDTENEAKRLAEALPKDAATLVAEFPELDNRLFVKKLESSVRTGLMAKGLTEAGSGPDLLVDLVLVGEDINATARGMMRGMGPQPVRSTAGTLVIDMKRPGDRDPVWRGVYRDDEQTGSKLVQKLPDDAKKLIDRYPKLR